MEMHEREQKYHSIIAIIASKPKNVHTTELQSLHHTATSVDIKGNPKKRLTQQDITSVATCQAEMSFMVRCQGDTRPRFLSFRGPHFEAFPQMIFSILLLSYSTILKAPTMRRYT